MTRFALKQLLTVGIIPYGAVCNGRITTTDIVKFFDGKLGRYDFLC